MTIVPSLATRKSSTTDRDSFYRYVFFLTPIENNVLPSYFVGKIPISPVFMSKLKKQNKYEFI